MSYQYPNKKVSPSLTDEGESYDGTEAAVNAAAASSASSAEEQLLLMQHRACKKYWAPQLTDALLKLIEQYREPLRNSRVQKQVWSEIAQRLNVEHPDAATVGTGGPFTGLHCSTKWRNLKRDLRLSIENGCVIDGRIVGRNPDLMSAVARLDSLLSSNGGESSNSDKDSLTNRRHSMIDFQRFECQQKGNEHPVLTDGLVDDEGPYDLSMAKQSTTPPVEAAPLTVSSSFQPVETLQDRSASFSSSSSGAFAVRRHRSVPTLISATAVVNNSNNNSLALLSSLLASSTTCEQQQQQQQQQLVGDLMTAASENCSDPLGEARQRLELMRRLELHSHVNRIDQLDRLISVIDAAIEAGGGGGSGGSGGGSSGN